MFKGWALLFNEASSCGGDAAVGIVPTHKQQRLRCEGSATMARVVGKRGPMQHAGGIVSIYESRGRRRVMEDVTLTDASGGTNLL